MSGAVILSWGKQLGGCIGVQRLFKGRGKDVGSCFLVILRGLYSKIGRLYGAKGGLAEANIGCLLSFSSY